MLFNTIKTSKLKGNANMKQEQIKHTGYVWWRTTALSLVAGELDNYCYLLVISSNDTTIDVRQNYCDVYWREDSQK